MASEKKVAIFEFYPNNEKYSVDKNQFFKQKRKFNFHFFFFFNIMDVKWYKKCVRRKTNEKKAAHETLFLFYIVVCQQKAEKMQEKYLFKPKEKKKWNIFCNDIAWRHTLLKQCANEDMSRLKFEVVLA